MKNKIPQILTVIALALLISMALPSSFAKYSGTETYTISISKKVGFFWNSWDTSGQVVTLPLKGRYAIIAKGGDGANGYRSNGDTCSYEIEGGIGGTVMAIYTTTTTNQKIYVAPGSAGTRPTVAKPSSRNPGGSNATGSFGGGSGCYVLSGDGFLSWLGSVFDSKTQSGGGGAATVVYAGNSSANSSNIILIAAGGGAGGCWNEGWKSEFKTVKSCIGGDGGGNIGAYASSDSTNVSSPNGTVYKGEDGQGEGSVKGEQIGGTVIRPTYAYYSSAGLAGYTSGGKAGKADVSKQWGIKSDGNESGSSFSNGSGGNAYNYGGGGGGGYCGGGGGTGTSMKVGAGGGGGGSSFISSSLTATTSNYSTIVSEGVKNTTSGTDTYGNVRGGAIPKQYASGDATAEGNGYVIIKYLGA